MGRPSARHATTTDGRGTPPSGPCEIGFSKVEPSPWVLHVDEHPAVVDPRPARLGPHRHREDLHDQAPVAARQPHPEQAVVGAQGVAAGGDPGVAVAVEGDVVRGGDGEELALVEAGKVGARVLGVPAQQQDPLPEARGPGVVAVVPNLHHLPVPVLVRRLTSAGACQGSPAPTMYTATRPSWVSRVVAASCLNRPTAVRLTGVDVGSYGLTSTTQPNRLISSGSLARSKRLRRRPETGRSPRSCSSRSRPRACTCRTPWPNSASPPAARPRPGPTAHRAHGEERVAHQTAGGLRTLRA